MSASASKKLLPLFPAYANPAKWRPLGQDDKLRDEDWKPTVAVALAGCYSEDAKLFAFPLSPSPGGWAVCFPVDGAVPARVLQEVDVGAPKTRVQILRGEASGFL